MSETRPFAPAYLPTTTTGVQGGVLESVTVTGTNSSATATPAFSGNVAGGIQQIRVANKTTAWAHIEFGVYGNVEAATVADSFAVAPGSVEIFSVAAEVSGASVILDAAPGTATAIIFTRGEGM
jgi:hypothetical protein